VSTERRALLAAVLLLAACAPAAGPPPIAAGTACVACGMSIQDLRYAAERPDGARWRTYDSIECLLRDAPAGAQAWLTDYDSRALVAADSIWVVRGDIPSPMGGGFAAFRDRAAAEDVAQHTRGRVDRLAAFHAAAEAAR
jgi:nitrous oxide reductase accessory protein NosL